jgi:uncharacterized lipoprotein YddW (UPF0748 family)
MNSTCRKLTGDTLRRGWLLTVMLYLAAAAPLSAQEFRAAWADVFHAGMRSSSEVNTMVSQLVAGHYNAVVVQVVAYMDTNNTASHGAVWKSSILPWATNVTANFDPLAHLCTKAHANGIEVHAWLGGSAGAMYRVSTAWPPAGNTTLSNNPKWFIAPLANSEGGSPVLVDGNYCLDMGSPDAQEYIVSIVKELVTNYPIDGINWDDELNGAGYTAGFGYPAYSQAAYPRSGLARYRINNSTNGTPSNTDVLWSDCRRRYKNELMARVQAEMQSIKTNPRQPLRHTSAALAYSPYPTSCDFTVLVPYTYFCDWAGMLQHGWLDAVIPQTYSSSTFNYWADYSSSCWQYNRQIFPGIGAYLNTDATIASEITYTRSKGMKGNCIYSYAVPNSAGNSDWWAYAAANVYTNVVSTPPMPWRNPATATEGIVWGRVSDANSGLYVDDATVTVTGGPTVQTDGNGYYVATLVPASAGGTPHVTTVSKAGMTSQVVTATVLPGDIVRYDLTLNASAPPSITTQPKSQSVNQGASATFTVAASGASPLSYQWRLYGTNLSGATATSYTRSNAQAADAGPYSVVITNAFGTATSSDAQLTVIVPPTIITQPQSQTVSQALNATFTVVASGTAPFAYQWRLNGANISSATASSYTRSNVQPADAGNYSVVVTNTAGSATSANAVLTVTVPAAPPGITAQPQSQTVNQGASATFTVSASGSTPLYYQWQLLGTNIPSATLSSYTRPNVQPADAGPYSVIITNSLGTTNSTSAQLTVFIPPTITTQPQSQSITQGSSVTFTVAASGTAPFGFQWRFNGASISGATLSSYTRSGLQLADAGSYSAIVTNTAGSATSANAVLTVMASPSISTQPSSQTVNQGNNVTFTVAATGTAPLSYQWRWYGTNLTGATATSLTLTAVATNQAGPYTAVITNAYGAITSQVATLTVTPAFQAGGLSKLWSLAPGSRSYLTTVSGAGPNERGLAYNPLSRRVLIVSRTSPMVYVLDADTGADLWTLNKTGVTGGYSSAYYLLMIGAADDGAIYAGNMTLYGNTTAFKLYRWSNDASGTVPTVAYSGDPGAGNSQRWGDTLDVRGSGPNTQVIIGSRNANIVAVLTTTDGLTFTAKLITVADAPAGAFGLGIAFGAGNTFWGKATSQNLRQVSFDLAAGTGTTLHSYADPTVPANVAPIGVNTNLNLLGGINVATSGGGNNFRLYDLAPTLTNGSPAFITSTNFATDNDDTYAGTGAVDFGGDRVYALCSNNGLLAMQIIPAGGGTPPAITTQPQPLTVNQGTNATFTVSVTGTAPLSYQWRLNGSTLSGATLSTYTIPSAQPANAGSYSVLITNVAGSVASADATLAVNVPPAIAGQPQPLTVNQSASATFTVSATGTAPLSYQWRLNGSPLPRATLSTYTIPSAQPANAGSYSVLVTNVAGSVASADATLAVNVPPAITSQPQSVSAAVGSNVTFTASATGTAPLSYQWRFNGADIEYGTASAYTCWQAQTTNTGSYSVLVSNMAGTASSADAILTVSQPIPPQIRTINLTPDGQVQLQVSAAPGVYAVEAISNLEEALPDWPELARITNTSTSFQYVDNETNLAQRLYRLHQVQ